MKIRELVDALPSIRKLSNQDLRAKTLYRVSLLLDRFDGELKSYDTAREKLIEKYCDTAEGKVIPKKGSESDFEREMLELLDMELDTANLKPVEIPADEDFRISYADLCAMNGFIKIKFDEEN
jgi:hypothetical protein